MDIKDIDLVMRDVHEIRSTIASLSEGLNELSLDLREFSTVTKSIVLRLEDRDKYLQEIAVHNKETFSRFGNNIDALEDRLRFVEQNTLKISSIESLNARVKDLEEKKSEWVERALTAILGGVGVLILFYLQTKMSSLLESK